MAPFETLFRAASASLRHTLAQATLRASEPLDVNDVEWTESDWGFYDSSLDLRAGLEVTEHQAPQALASLLQDSLA
jgi:hypothetical protein